MKRILSMVLALGAAVAVRGADLSEYVQDGLVAMWDGYRNQGADKPHDGTATNWYDTTGTYAFNFYRVFPGALGLKFSKYQHGGYAWLTEADSKATFEQAANGTVEIVYWHAFQTGCTFLRSSYNSGALFGSDGGLRVGARAGSVKSTWPNTHRIHTISASYDAAVATSVSLDGTVRETTGTHTSTINLGKETYLGYNQSFDGIIYAVRVYNRHLTAEELAQNAAADRERYFNRKVEATSSYAAVDYTTGVAAGQWYYVATGGSDENDGSSAHPFATVTNAHEKAKAYLAANAGSAAAIKIGEGTFTLDAPVDLVAGEKIVGAGRDKTFLDGSPAAVSDAEYALRLNCDDNLVRGLAVINIAEITKSVGEPHPRAFYVKKGMVDACRAAFISAQYDGGGYGFTLTGGIVTNSLADHVVVWDQIDSGMCANVSGGVLVDCELCDTDTNCDRNSYGNGLYVSGSGRVSHCRIHDCGQAFPYYLAQGAVYLNGGTFENSLVYDNLAGNGGDDAKTTAGVYVKSGTMRYCTVANNYTFNDVAGYSGLEQTGGTVKNCIFMNNGAVGNGVVVTAGTFDNNLVDKSVSGHDDNLVADTAYFKGLGAADFHIAARASLAVGKATPYADVTVDMDGVPRNETKPTIGAYEYVAPPAAFSADILIGQPRWRAGSSPTAELAVEGVTDYTKLAVAWTVDEMAFPSQDDKLEPVFEGLGVGYHTIGVTATYEAKTVVKATTNAVALLPVKVYVNKIGIKTFPYATPETGTDSPADALSALWKSASETSVVEMAAGTYALTSSQTLDSPIEIFGAGKYETMLTCGTLSVTPFTLTCADACLRDFGFGTSSKRGIEISAGCVRGCLVTNCQNTAEGGGGGVRMTGGRLLDSEIVGCSSIQNGTVGGGVAVAGAGAVVSNCHIHGNYATYGHHNDDVLGGGLYLGRGLVTHCRIVDNVDPCDQYRQYNGSVGSGVCVESQGSSPCTLRNCLIARNSSSFGSAVLFRGGLVENCTVSENLMTAGSIYVTEESSVVRVHCYKGAAMTMRNTVVWNNGSLTNDIPRSTSDAAAIDHCCWAEATEGASGNTARNPKLRAHRDYEISPFGSCYRAGAVQSWMTGATDLAGRPRTTTEKGVEKVDIGCHQVPPPKGAAFVVR